MATLHRSSWIDQSEPDLGQGVEIGTRGVGVGTAARHRKDRVDDRSDLALAEDESVHLILNTSSRDRDAPAKGPTRVCGQ